MTETPGIMGAVERSFKPWAVPGFASSEGIAEGVPIALLSPQTLDALAEAWLNALYQKASRPNHWKRSTTP